MDIGSTLVDESICEDQRIQETLTQNNAPTKEKFLERMIYYAKRNKDAYQFALNDFKLNKCRWPLEFEKLYSNVQATLTALRLKYKLGIICNQSLGVKERLLEYGILHYFDIIVSSSDVGYKKPSLNIFKLALKEVSCVPHEAVMIGDRVDNDIIPAQKIGMKTVWIKQGYGGCGDVGLLETYPDFIIDTFEQIVGLDFDIFLNKGENT